MLQERERAGGARNLLIGANEAKIGFAAGESQRRGGRAFVGNDAQPQIGGVVADKLGEFFGETVLNGPDWTRRDPQRAHRMQVIANAGDDQDGKNDSANEKGEFLPPVLSSHAMTPRRGLFVVVRVVCIAPIGMQERYLGL